MLKQAADKLAEYMVYQTAISEDMKEVVSYGFECMLATLLQVFLLLAVSLPFGITCLLTAFLLGFASLKRWVGGYHASSHFACLCQGSALVLLGTLAATRLSGRLDPYVCAVLLAGAGILVFRKAPVTHPNRPKSQEQRRRLARTARVTVLVLLLILPSLAWYFPEHSGVALSGSAGAFSAAATLLIPNSKERRE